MIPCTLNFRCYLTFTSPLTIDSYSFALRCILGLEFFPDLFSRGNSRINGHPLNKIYAHNLEFHYGLCNGKRSENRARVTLPLAAQGDEQTASIIDRMMSNDRNGGMWRVAVSYKNTPFFIFFIRVDAKWNRRRREEKVK